MTYKKFIKPTLFLLCLVPLAVLAWDAFSGQLGANPIEKINRRTGDWVLYMLLLTLAITPMKKLTGIAAVVRYRRMIGLYAFFYVLMHFSSWLVLDQFFDWSEIWKDIAKRPYITVGFSAFLLLIPLAVTSTNAMMRRLGRNWKRLHRLVYGIAVLGIIHYLWLVKADNREPLIWASVLAVLLLMRTSWFDQVWLKTRGVQRLGGKPGLQSGNQT